MPGGVLGCIERMGNRLPEPATMFASLGVLTLLASSVVARAGLSVPHPVTGVPVVAVDLLSGEGLRTILTGAVANFTGFAPLGTVLLVMLGIGIAERTGFLAATLTASVRGVPRRLVTPAVVFAGINSSVATDAGYVVLTPLAAALFAALGRHPLAGVAAVFAGVSGGFSASLALGALDPMLAGITQEAARLLEPTYTVPVTANYWFMAASVPLLTIVGWMVSDLVVEPRLGRWEPPPGSAEPLELAALPAGAGRGLATAGLCFVVFAAAVAALVVPQTAPLRDPTSGGLRPFFDALVPLMALGFAATGAAYGIATGTLRSDRDAARMMSEAMAAMGSYIVLACFAGQFVAWFRQSGLGLLLAIAGAELLRDLGLSGPSVLVGVALVVMLLNLVMASASAKWAAIAPVLVPMAMTLGWSPEVTQAVYRLGDSTTNTVTPLNPYFPLVIVAVRRWVPGVGLGSLLAAMLPYALAFAVAWTALLLLWVAAGLPVGPGTPLHWPA